MSEKRLNRGDYKNKVLLELSLCQPKTQSIKNNKRSKLDCQNRNFGQKRIGINELYNKKKKWSKKELA